MFILLSAINRPHVPTNLTANGDINYSVDSNILPVASSLFKGSGFLKGSAFLRGSGFMTAPEIFTGSGTLRGSGFLTHRQTDSTPKLNGHEIVEIVPLTIETNDISW